MQLDRIRHRAYVLLTESLLQQDQLLGDIILVQVALLVKAREIAALFSGEGEFGVALVLGFFMDVGEFGV